MNLLRLSLIQDSIRWEDKEYNISHFDSVLKSLTNHTDIAILPETFTSGFSMDAASWLAERNDEQTMQWLKLRAKEYQIAICGSFIARDNQNIFNRFFFVTPEGESYFYDKRHLFRMGKEDTIFQAGNEIITIEYKQWKIRPAVCYDLRFPVWLRNTADNPYDLLIISANWPHARIQVWDTLLKARAIENQAYVCGVNRTGIDGNQLPHSGHSAVIDYKGNRIAETTENATTIINQTINKEALIDFRNKFPAWLDADFFELK